MGLQHELVAAPVEPLHRDARTDQRLGDVEPCEVLVGDDGARDRSGVQRVHVAQPAPALLQVGFEQERDVTHALMALLDVLAEHPQPLLGARPPLVERTPREVVGQLGISRDATSAEQSRRGLQVARCDPERLGHGLHAVIEWDAGVPDRIPDLVRDFGDVRDAPPASMHEDHVDVAARGELTSAVAPDRDECAVGGVGEEANEVTRRRARRTLG